MKFLTFLLMLLALCPSVYAQESGWVLTTDYSTFGRVRSFLLDDPWTVSGDLATIPGDPTGRYHDGKLYIVGRGGASLIQIYDPETGFALVREFSIGAGRNPQDIAFDSAGEAYVSCYDEAVLLRVDVSNGTILDTFDTSMFADADGLPETAWMLARGDLLYIASQKLDRNNWYAPTENSALLVFGMSAEAWVAMDPKKTWMWWSSGKDSAWALHRLRQDPEIELVGLFTVINEKYDRASMHATRLALLQKQAVAAELPIETISLPDQCSNDQCDAIMGQYIKKIEARGIEYVAFGDLYLEDIRRYREQQLQATSIKPLFPLWKTPTWKLADQMSFSHWPVVLIIRSGVSSHRPTHHRDRCVRY